MLYQIGLGLYSVVQAPGAEWPPLPLGAASSIVDVPPARHF